MAFGGVDIVVSNAGAAWQGRIGDVDEGILRTSFELNFFAHQAVAQNAVRVMRAQGIGGVLLFNASKQAVNPGPDFGPYGLPKAATFALARQYALDHGAEGIRANAVNADRVRSGLLTDEMIASRARARGVSEADYMSGNLLGSRGHRGRRRAGVPPPGAGHPHHGRRNNRRRGQHRRRAPLTSAPMSQLSTTHYPLFPLSTISTIRRIFSRAEPRRGLGEYLIGRHPPDSLDLGRLGRRSARSCSGTGR